MRKILAAALLAISLTVSAPALAAPSTMDLLTQAQSLLATNPNAAAAALEQAAAGGASITPAQAPGVIAIIDALVAWASNPANQAANPNAVSSMFTSALGLTGTPGIVNTNPNLYSQVLAAAQEFINKGPKDNKKLSELEGFVQLAIGNQTPNNGAPGVEDPNDNQADQPEKEVKEEIPSEK